LNEVRCTICRKVRTKHLNIYNCIVTVAFCLMSLIKPKFHNHVFHINFVQKTTNLYIVCIGINENFEELKLLYDNDYYYEDNKNCHTMMMNFPGFVQHVHAKKLKFKSSAKINLE